MKVEQIKKKEASHRSLRQELSVCLSNKSYLELDIFIYNTDRSSECSIEFSDKTNWKLINLTVIRILKIKEYRACAPPDIEYSERNSIY